MENEDEEEEQVVSHRATTAAATGGVRGNGKCYWRVRSLAPSAAATAATSSIILREHVKYDLSPWCGENRSFIPEVGGISDE
jgi:hypothetical protein